MTQPPQRVAWKQRIGITTKETYVDYNLELITQDVSEILKQNKIKYLILENFHYLTLGVQEALAYDLRVFQDQGIIFIILGIWQRSKPIGAIQWRPP